MDSIQLVAPRNDLERSHAAFIEDVHSHGEELVPWVLSLPFTRFDSYVAQLSDAAKGIGLSPGMVPHSTFWLLDRNGEIVAVSNLRHALTDYLLNWGGHIGYGVRPAMRNRGYATEVLRRTLIEARALGIQRIRMTCDHDNVASARTILRNGGVPDGMGHLPGQQRAIARYWISLA